MISVRLLGQSQGIPYIKNYYPKDYKASPQNWDIVQDHRGVMYFGNSYGVLEFDGNHWELLGLANKTIVRSLAIDKAGKIYAGGQNDFAVMQADSTGHAYFKSIKDKVDDKNQNFPDVWKIYCTNEGVAFCTFSKIYYLKNDKIQVFPSRSEFNFPYYTNERLIIPEKGTGLLELKNNKLITIPNSKFLSAFNIVGILPFSESEMLIVTSKEGIFYYDGYGTFSKWQTRANEFFVKNEISCATAIQDGFAIGSTHNGLLIIDKKGNPIQHLNRSKGLQNDAILSIYPDKTGNLWLGLHNGIDYIEINSPFTVFNAKIGIPGTAYGSSIFKEKLYLGTNEGLFCKDWSKLENPINKTYFTSVENADGKVNNLQKVGNKLLLSHHTGPFEVIDAKAYRISDYPGIWMFMPLAQHPDYILCGTYTGLLIYKLVDNQLVFQFKVKGFEESSRVIEEDKHGNIWIAHGYLGIYKLRLSDDLKKVEKISFYNEKNGFPSNLFINVFKIKNELVFTAERGIYQYNQKLDRFEKHEEFVDYFEKDKHIRKLIQDPRGNIWFSAGNDMGMLKKSSNGIYEVRKNIFNKLQGKLVGGFEHIAWYDNSNVIIGTDEGFVHYNPSFQSMENSNKSFNALIRRVELTSRAKDSTVFAGAFREKGPVSMKQNVLRQLTLPYRFNSLRFNFSATSYEDIDKVEYQYFLEGFDKNWSGWTSQTQKEYTNLYEGEYTFHVKAKNLNGIDSSEATYSFVVSPPLARSVWAYLVYFVLAVGLAYLFKKLKDRSVAKAKERLRIEQEKALRLKEAEHAEEVLKVEKEVIKLNNEKLANELLHKNKELSSTAMHVMQSMDTIQKIKDQIEEVVTTTNDKNVLNHLRKLLKAIESDIKFQNHWDQFELHFNQIHEDFLKRLRSEYPELTHRDLRLCAYLRLNLSSKEMAHLLNLSIRGVETSRYRIRKKMNLDQDVNLTEFILKY